MSPSRCAVLTLVLFAAPAAAQDDLKAIIQKAVQAKGGADRIDRFPAAVIETKGTLVQGGHAVPFTARTVYELPDRGRIALEMEALGGKTQAVQVFDGTKARVVVNGQPKELGDVQTRDFRESIYAQNVMRLTPLLKDPGFTLTAADATTVGGKPAVGVKVASKDHRDVTLYFDRDSGLLVKAERPVLNAVGKEVKQEQTFTDYKAFEGLKHPLHTVVTRDGQKLMESETVDFKPLEKADPREFAAEGK
jgi:hypothetical protein